MKGQRSRLRQWTAVCVGFVVLSVRLVLTEWMTAATSLFVQLCVLLINVTVKLSSAVCC